MKSKKKAIVNCLSYWHSLISKLKSILINKLKSILIEHCWVLFVRLVGFILFCFCLGVVLFAGVVLGDGG